MLTEKRCSVCKKIKDISEFGKLSVSIDGHYGKCKRCLNLERSERRNKNVISVDRKVCRTCGKEKEYYEFYKDKSYKDGLSIDCKLCKSKLKDKADPNRKLAIKRKALNWIANGHIGLSSKTMWCCFMEVEKFEIFHPEDPNDFSRCYKLLESVPQWKAKLFKLKSLSKEWSNLVANWSELTAMYEQNEKEHWENSDKIGMYEFMQTLI